MTFSTSPAERPPRSTPDGDRQRPVEAAPGPVLFARYAYPPNALGYCGPGDPSALLGAAAEGTDVPGLGRLAARFEGAWPYLQLIAACNGLDDPLDRRVVEAYWVGNDLIARVPASALAHSLGDRFEQGPAGGSHLWCLPFPPAGSPSTVSTFSPSIHGWGSCAPAWTARRWRCSTNVGSDGDESRRRRGTWSPLRAGASPSTGRV